MYKSVYKNGIGYIKSCDDELDDLSTFMKDLRDRVESGEVVMFMRSEAALRDLHLVGYNEVKNETNI